jgi:hypothetical protein
VQITVQLGSPRSQETLCTVHDLGAKLQHIAYREDYDEVGGGNDRIMDLLNFRDDENCSCFLVDGQPYDLDFGLSEDIEALDVGGRHLGCHVVQCEFCVCMCTHK